MSQLTRNEVVSYFGDLDTPVLSFGAMFWMYGFGKEQPYPLKKYMDYMDVDLYRNIVSGLAVSDSIKNIVLVARAYLHGLLERPVYVTADGKISTDETLSSLLWSIDKLAPQQKFIAIHVRRGDYWNKCKHIKDATLASHCYPSIEQIEQEIEEHIDSTRGEEGNEDKDKTIYIATNIGESRSEFDSLVAKYNVLFFQDLFIVSQLESGLDPNQMALIDVVWHKKDPFL